jgi:hypothetical protein
MRRCLVLVGVGLAAAAIVAPEAAGHQARAAGALPKLIVGSYSGIKPKEIFFSGDAGNIVTKLKWQRWNGMSAVGHGTSDILNCIPNCAQGKATPVATSVTFSRVRSGHYTKVVELRSGQRYVGYYKRYSWPEGAR